MLEPSPASDWVAHTFLLLEFTDNRVVGVSIEARQEEGETYSPFWGLFNNYELLFSWASARDLLERRAVFLDHTVEVYPLNLSIAHEQSLLRKFLKTTSQLETTPRFYNTLFHNCTNELGKEAGIPWGHHLRAHRQIAELSLRQGAHPRLVIRRRERARGFDCLAESAKRPG